MPPRSGTVGFRRARERRCAELPDGGDHARTRRQSSRRKGVAVEWGCVPVGLNRLPYRPDRGRLGVSQQRGDDPARSPGRKRPDGGGEHAGIDSQHLYRRRRYRR